MKTRLLILFAFCAATINLAAQKVCNTLVRQSNTSQVYLSWETDRFGDVVITISNAAGATNTSFRGNNGMGKDLNCFQLLVPDTATGKLDTLPANAYFTKQYNGAGSTTLRLHLLPDSIVPDGTIIYYDGKSSIEWQSSVTNNGYKAQTFTYTYGMTCATLETPVLDTLSGDTLFFEPVNGAEFYLAFLWLGNDLITTDTVTSGEPISWIPWLSAELNITVRAFSANGDYSDHSNALTWYVDGDPAGMPASSICEMLFPAGAANESSALLTAETDTEGRVTFTISAADGGDEALTMWRNNGMNPDAFKYNGQPITDFFTRNSQNVNNRKEIIYTPRSDNQPLLGRKITYNAFGEGKTTEWKTSRNTNAYNGAISFSYLYGSVCPGLEPPVITDIVDSVPVFDEVDGADSYIAKLWLGSVLKYTQTILAGEALHFVPLENGTYQLTLTSHADGKKDSEPSEPFPWKLTAPIVELDVSEYCNAPFSSGTNLAYLTWQTTPSGDIDITINGDAGTSFRSAGMTNNIAEFQVGSSSAAAYFDILYSGDRSTLFTLHLKDTALRPALGEQIRYNGTVQYRTSGNSNAYGNYSFTYTYGTVCPSLAVPVIDSISAAGAIYLSYPEDTDDDEDISQLSYRINIYRGELLMKDTVVHSGDNLHFHPTTTYTYTVYARSVSNTDNYVPSDYSQPYLWFLNAPQREVGRSTLCEQFVSDNDGGVTLTAETLADGSVAFSLQGGAHAIWRADGMNTSVMTICGQPVSDYFDKVSGFVGDTLMILRLKPSAQGQFFAGDELQYNADIEWSVVVDDTTTLSRWVLNYNFTWVYGSTCRVELQRLPTPVITNLTDEGCITFSEVENAAYYRVRVNDADRFEVMNHYIAQGDTIFRAQSILPYFNYYVALQAWPEEGSEVYRESLWSEEVIWVPSWRELPPPDDDDDDWPTEINLTNSEHNGKAIKLFRNGQIIIILDGKQYNILGEQLNY